jgi:plastocyanin
MKRVSFLAWCALGAVVACSSSSTTSPGGGGGDAGGGDAASDSGGPQDAGGDGNTSISGCMPADFAANDHTATSDPRVIQAPIVATPAQFSPRCMRVKVGQTVTWQGDLASHPISYKITARDGSGGADGGTAFVIGAPDGAATMNTATGQQPMTIEFKCDSHPTTMFGAVDVVP